MADIPNPIQAAEDNLKAMLSGQWEGVSADRAAEGLAAAKSNKSDDRDLGFGLIQARPSGDGAEMLFAATDGTRSAALRVRLSGSLVAICEGQDEDPGEHAAQRLRNAVGSLPNDGSRYENILLQEMPLTFGA